MLSGLLSFIQPRTMDDEVKELERKLAEAKKKADAQEHEEEEERELEEEATQMNDDEDDEDDASILPRPRQKLIAKKALTPKKPTVDDKGKSTKKRPRGRPPTGENGEPKQWDDALGVWVEGRKRSNTVVRKKATKRQRVEEAVVDVDADEDWRTMMWTAVKKAVKPYVAEIVREVMNE